MNPWEGKHMWIWQLNQCGDPRDIVKKAVELGLTGILVKAWDGSRYWSQIESIIEPAKSSGLMVGAWGYSYGTDPWGEVKKVKYAVDAGIDWLVVDAEVEYEKSTGKEMANALGNAFRNMFPNIPIGYSSFGIPQYHPSFPWAEFSKWCNVVLPQVYWGDFKMSVNKALQMSYEGLLKYSLPIAPVGQCYNAVVPMDITLFGQWAKNTGLPGISYWSWQHATQEQFAAVGNAPNWKEMKSTVSDWAKQSWEKAVAKGIFDGTNPQGAMTREMLAVIIDRLGLIDDSPIPQEMVSKLKSAGLITNDHPTGAKITWGEFSTVIDRLLQKVDKV